MLLAVAPNREVEPLAQGVDHRHAHAVQAARDFVIRLVEFSARVQLRHDDLGRGDALLGVNARGDAPAVVLDGHGVVGMNRDRHGVAIARQRLVDRVVQHLVNHVVQPGAVAHVADVHARVLAHAVQSLQDMDGIGRVVLGRGALRLGGPNRALRCARRRGCGNGRGERVAGLGGGFGSQGGLAALKLFAFGVFAAEGRLFFAHGENILPQGPRNGGPEAQPKRGLGCEIRRHDAHEAGHLGLANRQFGARVVALEEKLQPHVVATLRVDEDLAQVVGLKIEGERPPLIGDVDPILRHFVLLVDADHLDDAGRHLQPHQLLLRVGHKVRGAMDGADQLLARGVE